MGQLRTRDSDPLLALELFFFQVVHVEPVVVTAAVSGRLTPLLPTRCGLRPALRAFVARPHRFPIVTVPLRIRALFHSACVNRLSIVRLAARRQGTPRSCGPP